MKIIPVNLSDFGVAKKGDGLIIIDKNNKLIKTTVRKVINSGDENEEIVFDLKNNKYFILDMFFNGMSWVKGCILITKR